MPAVTAALLVQVGLAVTTGAVLAQKSGDLLDSVTVPIENLRLATLEGFPSGHLLNDLVPLLVNEGEHGVRDLNGDGDCCDDRVVYVMSSRRMGARGLRLAVRSGAGSPGPGDDRFLAIFVSEEQQGHTDLNDDGDQADLVLFVYDDLSGVVRNLGLAVETVKVTDGIFSFVVDEYKQNEDFNSDGDRFDRVVFVYDPQSDQLFNTGLAVSAGFAANRLAVVVAVSEVAQGSTDLNGDGDDHDDILYWVPLTGGRIRNLSFDRARFSPGGTVGATRDMFGAAVSELGSGQVDLNGDGDYADDVLITINARTGKTEMTGLSTRWATNAPHLYASEGFIAINVSEERQGALDLNGDGDIEDDILHVLKLNPRLSTTEIQNTAIATKSVVYVGEKTITVLGGNIPHIVFAYGREPWKASLSSRGTVWSDGFNVTYPIRESFALEDLNGDGDLGDSVWVLTGPGLEENIGVASQGGGFTAVGQVSSGVILAPAYEYHQGNQDLNGDGYVWGSVLHLFRSSTGEAENLGLLVSGCHSTRSFAYCMVHETEWTGDLNGDGDVRDRVPHRIWYSMLDE